MTEPVPVWLEPRVRDHATGDGVHQLPVDTDGDRMHRGGLRRSNRVVRMTHVRPVHPTHPVTHSHRHSATKRKPLPGPTDHGGGKNKR